MALQKGNGNFLSEADISPLLPGRSPRMLLLLTSSAFLLMSFFLNEFTRKLSDEAKKK